MFCQKCGIKTSDDATFCNSCGAALVKTLAQPPLKEQRIEQVKNKIAESKKTLNAASQTGPSIILIIGAFLIASIVADAAIIFFIVGFILFLLGWLWSRARSTEEKKLKEAIFQYEGELFNLEKEP